MYNFDAVDASAVLGAAAASSDGQRVLKSPAG
jgi:hypothetical protein